MLKSFGTEFKVGMFTIVAAATLIYMFFVLSPDLFEDAEYETYYTVLDNAAGIVPKTHVKTNGVPVGKVEHVNLKDLSTHVSLKVDASVKVPQGSVIEIRSQGLLGDVHLEIVRSEDTGKYIEDGGFISQSKSGMDLNRLQQVAGEIAADIKEVTAVLARVLGSEKGEQSLTNIVDNIEALTADIRVTTSTLAKALGGREKDLSQIVSDVRDGVADLRDFSGGLKEILKDDNRKRIDRILASFDEAMGDVKGSAKNISLITEKVEKGEGTLGRLINDDNTLAELEGAIKDIRKVIAPATKLVVEVDYHSEFRRDNESADYVNLILRTRPDRFYLLGIANEADYDVETETIEPLTEHVGEPADEDNPQQVTVRRSVRSEKGMRFNAQVGKRWGWIGLRAGLFSNKGGVASDLHFINDKLRLSLEAYDFNTGDATIRRNAHIKAYANILFFNHIYLTAGIDDPTRTEAGSCEAGECKVDSELNYFVGAGLNFTDEDIKAVLGTAALAL